MSNNNAYISSMPLYNWDKAFAGYPFQECLPNVNLEDTMRRYRKRMSATKRAYIAGLRRGKMIARRRRRW